MASEKILRGKIALITGGSRGIGRAITLKLAAEGADVIINYFRKTSTAELTAQEARDRGASAHIIKANLAEPEKIEGMFHEIEAKFGRLDIFINNAASGVARSALELDSRGWDWTMDINARAFLLCAQRAARLMKDGGKMVAISSLGSRLVLPIYTAVGVSKAALEALTRYLAIELAPQGICVNAVAAGAVETEALKMYTADPNLPKPAWQTTPAGRMVKPEDIADLVAFLCTDQADMIRGQTIVIDGGVSLTPLSSPSPKD
ncbi:MAG TPA: enoyl-[acyl-carrier-protein] reductase FabL [Dehalococcoidia bacterium]|jgi:enoyl-[acyl-carrier protein] reductase III|nr:enoyl-[acyl-carrier-protein] reductase FabL [Dehalococcoidia bacterium]